MIFEIAGLARPAWTLALTMEEETQAPDNKAAKASKTEDWKTIAKKNAGGREQHKTHNKKHFAPKLAQRRDGGTTNWD